MKDTGFITLLNHANYNPINVGFYKDQYGRRGASAKITVNDTPYAIWFLQKDFPEGIYTCVVTTFPGCIVHPVHKYYEGRDMLEFVDWVRALQTDDLSETIDDFTHPWTELGKRIMSV